MTDYKILSIISVLCSLVLIVKKKQPSLPLYYHFIFWVCISENIISTIWKEINTYNSSFYSFFSLTCVLYYWYIFFSKELEKKVRQKYIAALLLLILFFILEFIQKINKNEVTNYSYVSGLTFIVIVILKRLSIMMSRSSSQFSSKEVSIFIFSIGILVFYFTSFPLLFFFDFLVQHNQAYRAYDTILKTGNFILHLGYLLTLIWLTKIQPSTTSS